MHIIGNHPEPLKEARKPIYHDKIVEENIKFVKLQIASSVSKDVFIAQSINAIDDLDRVCNSLSKRIREWYGYYFPELNKIEDHETFIKKALSNDKDELMKELQLHDSMGPGIGTVVEQKDVDAMLGFARQLNELFEQRTILKLYLENLMQEYCPNINAVVGSLIGAKLIERAGTLKHLSMMPSSTIQLLGAEKALFRHLRNKKIRPPKHGLILSHPYVMDSRDKGKAARTMAAKISIASKVDYFKGEFIGDKLKEQL